MSVAKVVVNMDQAPAYDVRIGAGILEGIGQRILSSVPQVTAACIITDSNVGPLYANTVRTSCKAAGLRTVEITLPAGEATKTNTVLAEVWNAMAAHKLDRNCVVVALGGGVVGDLAGFAAATFLRGVHVVMVPTSLLAMVDSSVGGKTAINIEAGKNLVGAFLQPAYVCADTSVLATLPDKQWHAGCAEIAKAAVIDSDSFFFWLEEHAQSLAARNEEVVAEAITRSVVFKANVVAADPLDSQGVRACLNYGHTLGHALEKLAGFGTLTHGEAVAEGMRFAARLGAALVGTPLELVEAQDNLLDSLGLPALSIALDAESILDAMRSDKKAQANTVHFVLPQDIGTWVLHPVDHDTLQEHVEAWVRSKA